jgi:hypothetical protein
MPEGTMGTTGTELLTRRAVSAEVTRLIAAATLAKESFPHEDDMPRLAAIPSNNLGHQVLLDYHRLALILWGTVSEIQEAIRRNPWTYLGPITALLPITIGVAAGVYLVETAHVATGFHMLPVVLGIGIAVAVYTTLRPQIGRIAADIRAQNLRLLLAGEDPPSAKRFSRERLQGQRLAEWGTGEVGGELCPVLIMSPGSTSFAGFGRDQNRQLFVCRPDPDHGPPVLSAAALDEGVSEALITMIQESGLTCVSSGQVVVIDAKTLRQDSPWLQADGAPPLFVERAAGPVQPADPHASTRVYTCIQAVAEEYLMCMTFFVRTFLAGNSAACEVNLSTLGPPDRDWHYIRQRLRLYERECGRGPFHPDPDRPMSHRTSSLGRRLRVLRDELDNPHVTFTGTLQRADVMRLKPFDPVALEQESREAARVAERSETWAGLYTGLVNWREQHSLTFTNDFFGSTESHALLRTLYDRICRAALSRLKELGYDISDYQDTSGRFAIKAESIEQLVIGEHVYMKKKPAKAKEQAAPAALPKGEEA